MPGPMEQGRSGLLHGGHTGILWATGSHDAMGRIVSSQTRRGCKRIQEKYKNPRRTFYPIHQPLNPDEAKSSTTISLIPTGVFDDLIPCRKYRGGAHSAPSITGTCHGRKRGNPPFLCRTLFFQW